MRVFAIKAISILSLFAAPSIAMAESAGGVDIAKNMTVLGDVALYVAFAAGVFVFANGLYKLYDNSKGRSDVKVGQGILEMLVGSLLVSIGWFYGVIKSSFLAGSKHGVEVAQGQMALALDSAAAGASSAVGRAEGYADIIPMHTINGVLAFIFLVGLLNMISGVFALKDINNSRSEHPVMKPIIKILAGAICMNILWFACLLDALLGIPGICVE